MTIPFAITTKVIFDLEFFAKTPIENLGKELGGPTLFKIPGRQKAPLFVSTLLHGNEHSGYLALQELANRWRGRDLPRPLWVFIGNPLATSANQRHLCEQPDYNRIWKTATCPTSAACCKFLYDLANESMFAIIDIHNNTGKNPHYSCVAKLTADTLYLASLYSRQVVYFTEPDSTFTVNTAQLAPSVTIECGISGNGEEILHVAEFIEACLHVQNLTISDPEHLGTQIYETVAIIKVCPHQSMAFGPNDGPMNTDLTFMHDLDKLNFREVPAGTQIGRRRANHELIIEPKKQKSTGLTQEWLKYEGEKIILANDFVPAMLTCSEIAVRQDCLGYLMRTIKISKSTI